MSPSESLCSSYSGQEGGAAKRCTQYTKATQFCREPQPHPLGLGLGLCQVHTRWTYHHQKTRNQGLGAT